MNESPRVPRGPTPTSNHGAALVTLCAGLVITLSTPLVLLAASSLSGSHFWYLTRAGGSAMWVLTLGFLLAAGIASLLGLGTALGRKLPSWPTWGSALLVLALGLAAERRAVARAREAVEDADLWQTTLMRIFAEGLEEALPLRSLAFALAAVLFGLAATHRAVASVSTAPRLSWNGRVTLLCGVGGLVILAGTFGAANAPRAYGLAVVAACCVNLGTLSLIAVGSAAQSSDLPPRRNATNPSLLILALALAAHLSVISYWRSWGLARTFSAIGGESVGGDQVAAIVGEGLGLAAFSDWPLPLFAFVPLLVAAIVAWSPVPRPLGGTLGAAAAVVLGTLAGVGFARAASDGDLEHCLEMQRRETTAGHEFVNARAGLPMEWGGVGARLWVSKDDVVLRSSESKARQLGKSADLKGSCEGMFLRVSAVETRSIQVVADASLEAERLACVMTGLYKLEPLDDPNGIWKNGPQYSQGTPIWMLRSPMDLPEPFAELANRVVEVRFGPATKQFDTHLHLHPEHWELSAEGRTTRLSGELDARFRSLESALAGKKTTISIAAEPAVSASVLLNVALLVNQAESIPAYWLAGFSQTTVFTEHRNASPPRADFAGLTGESPMPSLPASRMALAVEALEPEGLPREVFERTLRRNLGHFRLCHEHQLALGFAPSGELYFEFAVNNGGAVTAAELSRAKVSSLQDPRLKACIRRAFFGLSFPRPTSSPVHARVRLTFTAD